MRAKPLKKNIGARSVLAIDHKKMKANVPEQIRMPDNWTRARRVRSMNTQIQKQKNGGNSDLTVDPEKTTEPCRPADLRRKCYKDREGHGGGLRAALLNKKKK